MIDASVLRNLVGGDTDTRTWVSYGNVEPDAGDQHSVRFNDDSGNPLPHGVLVDVKLQPGGIVVPCRVASMAGGDGEGEYHPFVPGDEVVVLIPRGNMREGCVIIARMNQAKDVFPTKVAGMDSTQNNFGFKRVRYPFVIESAISLLFRQAATGANLTLDPMGQVTLADGSQNTLMMTPDGLSLMGPMEVAGFQINNNTGQASMVAGSTAFVVDDQVSQIQTSGTFSVSTAGNGAAEHVTTIEAIATIFVALGNILDALGPSTPLTGAALGAIVGDPGITPLLAAASVLPMDPLVTAAIKLAFSAPKTAGTPNLGCPGFLAS